MPSKMAKAKCSCCRQVLSPDDAIAVDGNRVIHFDCGRPRGLSHEEQALRLLVDTRIPFTNNTGERSFRFVKLHDKISGHFRNWGHAEAFLTVRSYLQTGAKHGRDAMELLTRLWTPTGAWLPSVVVTDTS